MKTHTRISIFQFVLSAVVTLIFSFGLSTSYGNVPLHEWTSSIDESNSFVNEKGEKELKTPENLTTWIFEDGTFIPMAKFQGFKSYSIITDHLGTPIEAYDEEGKKVWSRELGIYGQTRKETGFENFIPFLYQGQYLDTETELAYNRFRYYSPESGTYVSQDPIGLHGGFNVYSYVKDINSWADALGLSDIFIFGNSSGPANARPRVMGDNGRMKGDITVTDGNVSAQSVDPDSGVWPQGKSATTDLDSGLTGQVHKVGDADLPKGLGMVADGADVGGPHKAGHHTIFPTEDMSFDEFNNKLQQIETTHVGKVDKKKGFVPKSC